MVKTFKIGLAVLIQYRHVTDDGQTRCRSKDRVMLTPNLGFKVTV